LVGPVTGSYSADEALKSLLAATPLTYRALNDRAIIILRPEDLVRVPSANNLSASAANTPADARAQGSRENQDPAQSGERKSFWSRLRLAQTTSGAAQSTAALTPSSASSSPGGEPAPVQLEEVIVTAQKREERLIDVPIAISTFTGDELQKRGLVRLDDFAYAVPGLSIQNSGFEHRIVLRGVSNFAGSNSSLIGMYLDEANATSTRSAQLDMSTLDLERVEVLRGPQGTLYGEGSLGGTIRFITRDPTLDRVTTSSDLEASFTQDGQPGQRVEAAISLPVITDQFGVRIAGLYDHGGGWIDQPAAGRKD